MPGSGVLLLQSSRGLLHSRFGVAYPPICSCFRAGPGDLDLFVAGSYDARVVSHILYFSIAPLTPIFDPFATPKSYLFVALLLIDINICSYIFPFHLTSIS